METNKKEKPEMPTNEEMNEGMHLEISLRDLKESIDTVNLNCTVIKMNDVEVFADSVGIDEQEDGKISVVLYSSHLAKISSGKVAGFYIDPKFEKIIIETSYTPGYCPCGCGNEAVIIFGEVSFA